MLRSTLHSPPLLLGPNSKFARPSAFARPAKVGDGGVIYGRQYGLLAADYDLRAAVNGEEALAQALQRPPDLILSDVRMPHMDGFELLAALRSHEETRTIPVVMLSARADEEAKIEELVMRADDYLGA
jgi:CheY-like chemotaxis protein